MKAPDTGVLLRSACFSFTPSDTARELFLYPTWCGHYYCTDRYYIRRDTYPPLLVVYVVKGLFDFEFRGSAFRAGPGEVVLIDCREPHYYHAQNGLEFLYVHIDGSNCHELCSHILSSHAPLFRGPGNLEIRNRLEAFVALHVRGEIESTSQISLRLYDILCCLMNHETGTRQDDTPAGQAIRFIREDVARPYTLKMLAEHAGFSTFYFLHFFKEATGFSPMEFVTNERMNQARILLARTSMTLDEIASRVGYSSAASLTNTFKKKEGIPPGRFRSLHQAN